MNKTTEALKMAIEALEAMQAEAKARNCGLKICDDAIPICKEALESQEQKPFNYGTLIPSGTSTHKNISVVESQEQEPVVDVARVQEDGSVEWNPELPDLPVGTKLYTHPAQPLTRDWIGTALERADKDEAFRKGLIGELAQPLSDDEIRTIIANEGIPVRTGNTAIRFARAIEQAHGIGVKDG